MVLKSKLECVVPMVILSEYRMVQYRNDDHREDAPHFTSKVILRLMWIETCHKTCIKHHSFLWYIYTYGTINESNESWALFYSHVRVTVITVVLHMIRFTSLMNRHRLNFSIIWVVTYFGIYSKIWHGNRSVLMEHDG